QRSRLPASVEDERRQWIRLPASVRISTVSGHVYPPALRMSTGSGPVWGQFGYRKLLYVKAIF
ncbi:TPA: hypothetical protein ACJEWE_005461, partial [Klebsiella michiganensis]